jgi:hypothetical protein
MKKINKIELLNSEGCILLACLEGDSYKITDQWGKEISLLTRDDMENFIHGDLCLTDSKNRKFQYSSFPGSMKPDLKELDEFIGIDTKGKTY